MKILIDLNHPAHVHYFRNFIKLMEAKGHKFCIINRDSKMINQLLDYYGIEHTIRNKRPGKKGAIISIINLVIMTLWVIRKSLWFHPDMYMGFGNVPCSVTSWLFRKPSILIDDTDHNTLNHRLYMPVCAAVLTPFYFNRDLGNKDKQIRFNAYVEQLYLHSVYFKSSTQVLEELNVKPKEYVIVRYIAYDAHHDLNAHPLSTETKKSIVREIAKRYRVFVSLEKGLNDPFYDEYLLKISPEKMHDLEANAKFMVTEGATMASEAFVLGTPYLYVNPLRCCNIDIQCKNYAGRCYQSTDGHEVLKMINQLMDVQIDEVAERRKLEEQTINPTKYLEEFVEKFGERKNE